MMLQPGAGFRDTGNVEAGGNVGALGAMAYGTGIGPATHGQPQGIEHNRLAGAGFTGQGCHTAVELEFNPFCNGVVRYRELCEHAATSARS